MTQQEDRKFNRIQKGKSCSSTTRPNRPALQRSRWNFSIISTHEHSDVLTNEYVAGFIQGELQGKDMIRASRNNTWKNSYLCDTSHTFPHTCPPEPKDLKKAENSLKSNSCKARIRCNTGCIARMSNAADVLFSRIEQR